MLKVYEPINAGPDTGGKENDSGPLMETTSWNPATLFHWTLSPGSTCKSEGV